VPSVVISMPRQPLAQDGAEPTFKLMQMPADGAHVAASSYCEPFSVVKAATWHWFALRGDEPRLLLAFPGAWKRWRGPIRKDGPKVEIDVYVLMTTEPNSLSSTINRECVPVLFGEEEELTGSPDHDFRLIRSFASFNALFSKIASHV